MDIKTKLSKNKSRFIKGYEHKTMSVRLPEPIYYLVKASAEVNNTSMSVVIAHLLLIGWKEWYSAGEGPGLVDLEELAAREYDIEPYKPE